MYNYLYKYFLKIYIYSVYQKLEILCIPEKKMVTRIFDHTEKVPDYINFGIKTLSLLFLLKNLFAFKKILSGIEKSRGASFSLFKNLIRFHDSVIEVANVDEIITKSKRKTNLIINNNSYDFIIVGSGPGGAVAALQLQKNGYNTCILESGKAFKQNRIKPFSYSEMVYRYKNAGVTTTMMGTNITYVEGQTVGGGSEINSGLYHRTPEHVLKYWEKKYLLKNSSLNKLEKYFKIIEDKLSISYFPEGKISKASLKLEIGAKKLGWSVQEVPRWFKYDNLESADGVKMTMAETYLKDYLDVDGKIFESSKVQRLKKDKNRWTVDIGTDKSKKKLFSDNIILSAGTIGTAQILRKSKISKRAGNQFQMHPTIKVIALFNEEINQEGMGVPVHQVKEFAPEISFGCSISSKPYLKVAMLDHFEDIKIVEKKWKNMAIYYAMISPEGFGSIKTLPFFKDPLLNYNLTKNDKINLSKGLKKLCKLLITSGSTKLFPSIKNGPVIKNMNDINKLPKIIDKGNTSLMTVHLFSSCPLGEKKNLCVADSYGKVFGQEGLFISDGSMLPSAVGVNPQGSIMALAHRNISKIISDL